jgi:hypothetical protein
MAFTSFPGRCPRHGTAWIGVARIAHAFKYDHDSSNWGESFWTRLVETL